jgi:quercetin dioxygenase-like cupin family protein
MSISGIRTAAALGLAAAIMVLSAAPSGAQTPGAPKFHADKLQQVPINELPPGKWSMKATLLAIEPGGEVPFHAHKGPGLRYVLEGAITINWKEGRTRTYQAGATYFEGPGENHPAGMISARNSGAVPCRVLIIELAPQE